jgi:hypothetical protein
MEFWRGKVPTGIISGRKMIGHRLFLPVISLPRLLGGGERVAPRVENEYNAL